MIGAVSWPDFVIGAVIALAAFFGFKRGFIKEIAGLLALVAMIVAPHYYNGAADGIIDRYSKLGPIGAHLVGMLLTGLFAYIVVIAVASVLNRIAKLPILGTGNALAGGIVGFVKGAVAIWLLLYVALFFPLTPAIRTSLHASKLAPYFVTFDGPIDAVVESAIPSMVRPMVDPYFARHHL
jgi:membrane protein required for colicin V production